MSGSGAQLWCTQFYNQVGSSGLDLAFALQESNSAKHFITVHPHCHYFVHCFYLTKCKKIYILIFDKSVEPACGWGATGCQSLQVGRFECQNSFLDKKQSKKYYYRKILMHDNYIKIADSAVED